MHHLQLSSWPLSCPATYDSSLFTPTVCAAATSQLCDIPHFASLSLDSIHIDSLEATAYTGFTVPANASGPPTTHHQISTVDICLLTVHYTHPGDDDAVTTWIGLPLNFDGWNGRFLMVGGGGWVAGTENSTISAVASGYASASTNAGHNTSVYPEWGLLSNGSVNLAALEDFASRALVEAVYLGKQAAELYFESRPVFSYWSGCSTGGRQAHVMAELIPEEFDGLLSGAPAINWAKFVVQAAWGYVKALEYGISPQPCVLDAFTKAAIDACDVLDGVKDGLISLPGICDFKPFSMVGETVDCFDLNTMVMVTQDMANLVQDIWDGPATEDGRSLWYGLPKDANLNRLLISTCTSPDDCVLSLFPISQGWIQIFILEQPISNTFKMTVRDFYRIFEKSVSTYAKTMSFDNPDLTNLKESGAKMLVWHGAADPLIMVDGSVDYYERVVEKMGNVDDFYRLFLAPGIGHCGMEGDLGLDPTSEVFFELVDWVENGKVSETIAGTGPAVGSNSTPGFTRTVGLCPYPRVLSFTGTDPNDDAHFDCL